MSEKQLNPKEQDGAAIKEAIRRLTESIGSPEQGIPTQDRTPVIETLEALRDHGHFAQLDQVHRLVIENGWDAIAADQVRILTAQVLNHRGFRKSGFRLPSNACDYWRTTVEPGASETSS